MARRARTGNRAKAPGGVRGQARDKAARTSPRKGASSVARGIAKFLRTGECDVLGAGWPGEHVVDRLTAQSADLAAALLAEVRRRAKGHKPPPAPPGFDFEDLRPFTRAKVAPMVRGLFPAREHEAILSLLENSLVFLTPGNVERLIVEGKVYLETKWLLANAYLSSVGAEPFCRESVVVGVSEDTTCYVTLDYFTDHSRFADYVVHEAAHVFHNCKRRNVGLPHTRSREWLLKIALANYETFAYACEVFSRIVAQANDRAGRLALAEDFARGRHHPVDRVDPDELIAILREAAGARNGWKRILARCMLPPHARPRASEGSDEGRAGT